MDGSQRSSSCMSITLLRPVFKRRRRKREEAKKRVLIVDGTRAAKRPRIRGSMNLFANTISLSSSSSSCSSSFPKFLFPTVHFIQLLLLLAFLIILSVVESRPPISMSLDYSSSSGGSYSLGRHSTAKTTTFVSYMNNNNNNDNDNINQDSIGQLLKRQPIESHNEPTTTRDLAKNESQNSRLVRHDANSSVQDRKTNVVRVQQQQQQTNNGTNSTDLDAWKREEAFEKRLARLKQKYITNRAINDTAYYILLLVYSSLISFGTVSNSLICLTVILRPQVLSPRNIFIVNLAYSDLLLCVFTMPFSFIEVSMKMWHMGLIPCKLVAGLQATSIFVSTISITAIALDRYKVIVYPTHQETSARTAALILGSVWLGALLLSSPLFCFRTVEHLVLPHKYDKIESIDFCVEDWPFKHGRGIYSVISMIFQYVLPISIVCSVYLQISRKLKKRLIRRQRLTQLECQQKRQLNLIKRTHTMLVSVALVFILSWLPLNLLNLIGDFSDVFKGDDQQFRLVFAVCHLIGCSSACSNPILYGYLNENFRKELHQVYSFHLTNLGHFLRFWFCRLCCCFINKSPSGIYAQRTPTSSIREYADSSSSDRTSDSQSQSQSHSQSSPTSSSSGSTAPSSSSRNQQSGLESSSSESESEDINSNNNNNNNNNNNQSYDNQNESFRVEGVLKSNQDNEDKTTATTLTNSMGRTMRFCLCITNGAGSSSTETLGTQLQLQQQQQQLRQQTSSIRNIGGKKKTSLSGNNIDDRDLQRSRIRRSKRGFRCKCQCHIADENNKSIINEATAAVVSNRGSISKKSRENNNNGFVGQDQLRRSSRCSVATTATASHQQQQQSGNRFAWPFGGRRVWLRFWPAANNEPTREQVPGTNVQVKQEKVQQQKQQLKKENEKDSEDAKDNNDLMTNLNSERQLERPRKGQRRASGIKIEDKQLDEANEAKQHTERKENEEEEKVDKQEKTKKEMSEKKKNKKSKKNSKSKSKGNSKSNTKAKSKSKSTSKKRRRTNTVSSRHCDSCREAAILAQQKSSRKSSTTKSGLLSQNNTNNNDNNKNNRSSNHENEGQANAQVAGSNNNKLELPYKRQQQQKQEDKETTTIKGCRIDGLELDLMLVGPGKREQPSQFAGSLYLSVANSNRSRCSSKNNPSATTKNKSSHKTTNDTRHRRIGLDESSRCSLAPERSTSVTRLELTSFGISEQHQAVIETTASEQKERSGLDSSSDSPSESPDRQKQKQVKVKVKVKVAQNKQMQLPASDGVSLVDVSAADNDDRVQPRESSSDSVGPRNEFGQVRQQQQPTSIESTTTAPGANVRVFVDRRQIDILNTCADNADNAENEVKDSKQPLYLASAANGSNQQASTMTTTQMAVVQPEGPISGPDLNRAATLATNTDNRDSLSSSNSSHSHSTNSFSLCLSSHSVPWHSNSSTSCICSVLFSSGDNSSGRSSCTSQPVSIPPSASLTALTLNQQQQQPQLQQQLQHQQQRHHLRSSFSNSPTVASALDGQSSISGEEFMIDQESKKKEEEREKQKQLQLQRQHQNEKQKQESCSSSPLELQDQDSNCSSSLRSLASLEVARLMDSSRQQSTNMQLLHQHKQTTVVPFERKLSSNSENTSRHHHYHHHHHQQQQQLVNGFHDDDDDDNNNNNNCDDLHPSTNSTMSINQVLSGSQDQSEFKPDENNERKHEHNWRG